MPGIPGGGCTSRKSGGGSLQHDCFGMTSQIQHQTSTKTITVNDLLYIPVKHADCKQLKQQVHNLSPFPPLIDQRPSVDPVHPMGGGIAAGVFMIVPRL